MNFQRYQPREVILFPGAAKTLYRVHDGLVRLHAVDDEGRGLTLRYVRAGGYFGTEALTGASRRYFAEAVTACTLEPLVPESLSPDEQRVLGVHLAEALGQLYRALTRLSGKRLKARVAAELLELSGSPLASHSDGGAAVIHITHDDLAAAVGSVRETVTKVIGELAREGALEAGYGKVILADEAALRQAADE